MIEQDKNKQPRHFRKGFLMALLSVSFVIPMTLGVVACSPNAKNENNEKPRKLTNKNFLAYYRAWRDKEMKGVNTDLPDENWITMNDIPYGINIVNVFSYVPPGEEELAQPYFDKLQSDYGPALRARGIKLIRGFDYGKLYMKQDEDYQGDYPTKKEVETFADQLIRELMVIGGFQLDGLDIDMEQRPGEKQIKISNDVIRVLAQKIGPQSGNKDSLFLYDTNGEYLPAFEEVADSFDLLAYQQYGNDSTRTKERVLPAYEPIIGKSKIMPGQTFPEEQDHNRWYDTSFPYEESHIYDVAKFVQDNDLGGMFVYALDRDGRNYEEDLTKIKPSNLLWTKTAILESNGVSLDIARELAQHHLDRIQYWTQLSKSEMTELQTKIADAQNLLDINAVVMGYDYPDGISPNYDPILENDLFFSIDFKPAHKAINQASNLIVEGNLNEDNLRNIEQMKQNLEKLMGSKEFTKEDLNQAVNNLNKTFSSLAN